ncbi:MAG: UvrD-helicase domain-containing protein, partial [Planctomycetota bacterium]
MKPLTREQEQAAFARERTVAVVAGAGTGKTRVLAERYLHLVLDRHVDLQRILTVTFTDKAAREMKQRIRRALAGRGRPGLARAVEFAPISTIHAFLARTRRER